MATDRRGELSSVRNARSLGGLYAASGRTAHGVFCRSDVPLSLTEEDICVLRSYRITHVLDLRSEAEVQAHPSAARACFEYLNVPLQGGDKIPQTREEVPASYLNMTMGTTQMARAMCFLADAPDGVLIHCTAGKDRTDAAAALTDARKKLADLLASSGRPADALEPHFTCRLCEDTGIVDGRTCSCVHKVMQQLRRSEIEALSSLSISSFDTMELRYYPARMDASLGEPIRSYMSTLLDDLRGYADEFDTTSESLMLLGNAGLGKTHAALAIAGEVLEKGFDVIYVSSPDFFSKLEALHFGSDPAGEEEMLLRTAAGADLLILDDLGSEFNSSFLISTLYSLLNNRLGAKLPTIVTTNITDGALLEKLYTEKISSRLSSFVPFLFMGDDIRAQKAEEA